MPNQGESRFDRVRWILAKPGHAVAWACLLLSVGLWFVVVLGDWSHGDEAVVYTLVLVVLPVFLVIGWVSSLLAISRYPVAWIPLLLFTVVLVPGIYAFVL